MQAGILCVNKPVRINPAPAWPVCLIAFNLQLERKTLVAKSALAGLLAFLLLFSSLQAVSSAHRQSHHFGRGTP